MKRRFRITTISVYDEDVDRADALVSRLRKAGYTSSAVANRSRVIRAAIILASRVPEALFEEAFRDEMLFGEAAGS